MAYVRVINRQNGSPLARHQPAFDQIVECANVCRKPGGNPTKFATVPLARTSISRGIVCSIYELRTASRTASKQASFSNLLCRNCSHLRVKLSPSLQCAGA